MKGPEGRLEAAARLREYGRDALKDGSLLKTLKDVTGGDSWRHVLLRLADLIDPTCRAVHQGASMDDELVCSECGALLGVEVGGEQMFVPNFCPCCGARVVRGDG